METGKKFRNHISVVAEEVWGSILALLILVFVQGLPELAETSADDLSFLADKGLWIVLGLIVILAVLIGNRLLVWARTYIYLEDNAIVIEKNTVNKKKNTIGIKNISNINLERNLFEMLVGTCKVKLDTNSLSTADKTDVKIVLKKADAERFRREVTARMHASGSVELSAGETDGISGTGDSPAEYRAAGAADGSSFQEAYDVRMDFGDIIRHGLFSINIFSVLLLLAGIGATVGAVVQVVQNPGFIKSLLGAAAGILVAASIVLSALWDTVKDFVKYYDFRAKRRGNRLFICYGLLKKMEYTIPTDKIQALRIHQSLVARICGRYMAEIVNVGMGDEKEEKNSFLVLYCTKEKMRQQLELLLPEMAPALDQEVKKQPGTARIVWAFHLAVYVLAVLLAAAAGVMMTAGMASSDRLPVQTGICGGAALLMISVLTGMILGYRTAGMSAGETVLKLRRGYFGTHYTMVKYSNIQYADFSQSFLARRCGIRKGQIHLLAAAGKASYDIPYFADGLEEIIKAGMLGEKE